MKKLNDAIKESLLDDENILMKDTTNQVERNVYFKKLKNLINNYKYPRGGTDFFGRFIKENDIVYVLSSLKPLVGVVERIYASGETHYIHIKDVGDVESRNVIIIPNKKIKDFIEIIS